MAPRADILTVLCCSSVRYGPNCINNGTVKAGAGAGFFAQAHWHAREVLQRLYLGLGFETPEQLHDSQSLVGYGAPNSVSKVTKLAWSKGNHNASAPWESRRPILLREIFHPPSCAAVTPCTPASAHAARARLLRAEA